MIMYVHTCIHVYVFVYVYVSVCVAICIFTCNCKCAAAGEGGKGIAGGLEVLPESGYVEMERVGGVHITSREVEGLWTMAEEQELKELKEFPPGITFNSSNSFNPGLARGRRQFWIGGGGCPLPLQLLPSGSEF